MATSDGTLLNLASELAATAAGLQATHSRRRSAAKDPVLVQALDDVKAAIASLSSAVHRLSAEVADDDADA